MHPIQEKLVELSRKRDLSKMTLGEITRAVGEKYPQAAKHHLLQLDMKGILPYPFGFLASTEPTRSSVVAVPLIGSANCGPAKVFADENVEGFLKVSPNLLPKGRKVFAIRAVGSSMNKALAGKMQPKAIEDGDYVIVEAKRYAPKNGDYVLSVIDGAANIKKFRRINEDEIALVSESTQNYAPIFLHAGDDIAICGEIVQVLKG